MRINIEIVIRVELNELDIPLETCDRARARIFFAPLPDLVQTIVENRRKSINVLVPGAVEIAEEEQVVILQLLGGLSVRQFRKGVAPDDDPAREMNERKLNQILLLRFESSEDKEDQPEYPGLPRLHGRNCIHRIRLAVDIRHWEYDRRDWYLPYPQKTLNCEAGHVQLLEGSTGLFSCGLIVERTTMN